VRDPSRERGVNSASGPGLPAQLVLDFGHHSRLGPEDLLVGPSNRAALALVEQWPDWPHWAAVLTGPPGSGKTHIANVWRQRSGADAVEARTLDEAAVPRLAERGALLVEGLEQGIADERVLFHLLNVAREQKGTLLATSQLAPGELSITLPDLRSRLCALPMVGIEPPDDALLKAVLVKLFADRQLAVEPAVIDTITRRMERSMAAAGRIVDAVDRHALARQRRVSRALAVEVLNTLGHGEEEAT
jgi:chromosomal replication initiation ATPase DnaA